MKDRRGEYTLGFDSCPWKIVKKTKQLVTHLNDFELQDKTLPKLLGLRINDISFDLKKNRCHLYLNDEYRIDTSHSGKDHTWYILAPGRQVALKQGCQVVEKVFIEVL